MFSLWFAKSVFEQWDIVSSLRKVDRFLIAGKNKIIKVFEKIGHISNIRNMHWKLLMVVFNEGNY